MKTFTIREQAHKGISLTYQQEGTNELLGIPLGQGILKEMDDALEEDQPTTIWNMLDVVPDAANLKDGVPMLRLIKEQNIRDKRALIYVETAPGVGGTVKLFANTPNESYSEEKKRVIRENNPFPSVGAELLAQKDGVCGPEFLVSLLPGASFKIVRSGNLTDTSRTSKGRPSPEMVVVWNGHWDHRAEHDFFRNPDPVKYKQFTEGKLRRGDFNKHEWDSFLYKQNPMKPFWGLSVFDRRSPHSHV